ncbi:CLUMA_CG019999, isoform A [Clunio marinus]|uniref:CLUMA_CG019999, isoform A n=1 Tax=Clunio marinus TaxID=568069 RepID=A0A1J1J599_9DIPT|nr:CLUMA_CG019999, isoform A [Clunio marinus]
MNLFQINIKGNKKEFYASVKLLSYRTFVFSKQIFNKSLNKRRDKNA